MPARPRRPWPKVTRPHTVRLMGPADEIDQFALELLERESETPYVMHYPDGTGLLAIRIDEQYLEYIRLLGKRRGLSTKRIETVPDKLAAPWSVRNYKPIPAPPLAYDLGTLEMQRPADTFPYVLVDTLNNDAAHWLNSQGIVCWVLPTATARLCYFNGWTTLAKRLRREGFDVRPAYGVPRSAAPLMGTLPFSAISPTPPHDHHHSHRDGQRAEAESSGSESVESAEERLNGKLQALSQALDHLSQHVPEKQPKGQPKGQPKEQRFHVPEL